MRSTSLDSVPTAPSAMERSFVEAQPAIANVNRHSAAIHLFISFSLRHEWQAASWPPPRELDTTLRTVDEAAVMNGIRIPIRHRLTPGIAPGAEGMTDGAATPRGQPLLEMHFIPGLGP